MKSRRTLAIFGDTGAVAVLSGLMLTTLLGFAALSLDVGVAYVQKRDLQSATDAAALAATFALYNNSGVVSESTDNGGAVTNSVGAGSASAIATQSLASNGYAAANLVSATPGVYCPDNTLTPAARFPVSNCASLGDSGSAANAVKVTTKSTSPFFFGRILSNAGAFSMQTSATAAQINEAGFYAGTGLASLSNGLVNNILNGLLPGSNISLNALDYNGLLQTNVSALDFFNALNTELGVNAGTYGSLLTSSASVGQILQAAVNALNTEGNVSTVTAKALSGLAAVESGISGSPTLQLSNLFDLGVWQDTPLESNSSASALNAGINLYQLLTLSAEVANGKNFLTIPTSNLSIPNVASVSVASTVIEPPQSPPFSFGPVGISVHTSQVRLQLSLNLLNTPSILGTSVSIKIPIYVEVADGDAELENISCGTTPATDATVTIAAKSGVVNAFIGNVAQNVMTNFSSTVQAPTSTTIGSVTVAGLQLLTITAAEQVSLASGTATDLTFTQSDITNQTAQTVSSTGVLTNLLSTLNPTSPNCPTSSTAQWSGVCVNLAGVQVGISALTGLLSSLSSLFGGLDTLVDNILAALGIKLGYMDVTATGVRCGVPVLVQ